MFQMASKNKAIKFIFCSTHILKVTVLNPQIVSKMKIFYIMQDLARHYLITDLADPIFRN